MSLLNRLSKDIKIKNNSLFKKEDWRRNFMRKRLILAILVCFILALAACSKKEESQDTNSPNTTQQTENSFTVTFYDGETVLKTEIVESGKTIEEYTPEKEGYEFLGWYATPSYTFNYDFTKEITSDTSIFSNWKSSKFTEDTRNWMIAGESSIEGAPLNKNSWGQVSGEAKTPFLLTRKSGTNEFSITIDLFKGDKFQLADVAEDFAWKSQRGFGYISEKQDWFKGDASPFADGDATANISIEMDGNYTITLITDVENESLDTMEIVRNGDVSVTLEKSYLPNLSGTITGGMAIADKTALGNLELKWNEETSRYETEVSLNKGDYFSVLLNLNSWDTVFRTSQVNAEESDACYETSELANITMKESGKYYVGLSIDDSKEAIEGSVIVKKVGDFERTEGDNELQFKLDESNTVICYVKQGARVPNPGVPNTPKGSIFIGWYQNLTENIPQAFTVPFEKTGETILLEPKFMTEEDTDSRDVYVKGSFNAWAGNDENYKMKQEDKHTYTITLTVEKAAQIMFTFFEGEKDTGTTANGSIVDYENSTNKASGTGNITFSEAGTYTIKLDTYKNNIIITE